MGEKNNNYQATDDDNDVSFEEYGFADYIATTTDPGIENVMLGTAGIAVLLLLISIGFLFCRRRRRWRKATKAAAADAKENAEDEHIETYLSRRPGKHRLRFFPDASAPVQNGDTSARRKSSSGNQENVQDALANDLFEDGGIIDHIHVSCAYSSALNEDDETELSGSVSKSSKASKWISFFRRKHSGRSTTPTPPESLCDFTAKLVAYDSETKKLLKLAVPYSLSTLLSSSFNVLSVAAIGRLLGTEHLSAYILVYYAFSIGSMFTEGLLASITPVCSQAIGAEQFVLAGQYVQISVLLALLSHIPQIFVWWFLLEQFMLWMEFDANTTAIAQLYAKVYGFSYFLEILKTAMFNLLNVCGQEKFAAVSDILWGLLEFICTASLAWYLPGDKTTSLLFIGIGHLALDAVLFLGHLLWIHTRPWIGQYRSGLFGTFNAGALGSFLKTAIPLSIGHVLSFSEWEILFLLAGVLGPAEVAAWGIVGEIWSALEELTYAWGDAAEVRCATMLGSGQPERAELSAFKALLLGSVCALALSGTLYGVRNILPDFICDDETLDQMVSEVIPLVAFGNVVLTIGSISWQLIGAQGRYSLATVIQFFGSWLVTLPLALLSALHLRWNLSGLVAAVIIGYAVSGTLNFIVLCCTKWERRSKRIMAKLEKSGSQRLDTDSSDESDSEDECDVEKVQVQSSAPAARQQQPAPDEKYSQSETSTSASSKTTTPGTRDSSILKQSRLWIRGISRKSRSRLRMGKAKGTDKLDTLIDG